jgi:hypothetical protein
MVNNCESWVNNGDINGSTKVISRDDMGRYLLAICYIAIGK